MDKSNPTDSTNADGDDRLNQQDILEWDSDGSDATERSDWTSMTRREILASSAGVSFGLGTLSMSTGRTRSETAAQAGETTNVAAGHLQLKLKATDDAIHLQGLYDELGQRELLAAQPGPLWKIVLYNPETDYTSGERIILRADEGWQTTQIERQTETVELHWQNPKDDRFDDVSITVNVTPYASDDTLHWDLNIVNDSEWSVYEVAFPQVGVRQIENGNLFSPVDEGSVDENPWRGSETGTSAFNQHDGFDSFAFNYPGHFVQLQYFSVYEPAETGLYFGLHDPDATVKTGTAKTLSVTKGLRLRFRQNAPDMIVAGNDFELSGEGVWQLYEGDWYDAAQIYRKWATQQKWYPELGSDGRDDTPQWMKELPVWIQYATQSNPDHIEPRVEQAKEFAEYMDVPVGAHWYGWYDHAHDDNYPRFPPIDGFAEAVDELQGAGIHVMPYINSRLWDVDLDSFDTVAREGACKAPNGEPYITHKPHADFATMDPSTDLWQKTVRENALELFTEYDVDIVYLDQMGGPSYVRADKPSGYPPTWTHDFNTPKALCTDPDHGHPLGGGHWWTDGYRELAEGIREEMPADKALTCEHAPEMYIDQLDGSLTWTWGRGYAWRETDPRRVPAFVAVYGGAVQMFGRDINVGFTGNEERVEKYAPSVRQKTAMMLIYGNQLGWWNARVVNYKSLVARYARRAIRLRYELSRYFYAGQMVRPPELDVPESTTQWPRKGGFPVTTDAVQSSAWEQLEGDKLVFIFTNPTEDSVTTDVEIDLKQYDKHGEISIRKISSEGPTGEKFTTTRHLNREVTFEPKTAWAWEVITEDEDDQNEEDE